MENLSSAGKIPRVTGGMLSAGKYQPRSQVTFSFFLENVYREPRDQPQPGSFGCFLEGGRDRTLGTSLRGRGDPLPVSGKTAHKGD